MVEESAQARITGNIITGCMDGAYVTSHKSLHVAENDIAGCTDYALSFLVKDTARSPAGLSTMREDIFGPRNNWGGVFLGTSASPCWVSIEGSLFYKGGNGITYF
eukprot:jgi/Tetstr1/453678/TSEL_040634.t1